MLDDLSSGRADPLAPVERALWRPLAARLVQGLHVLALGADRVEGTELRPSPRPDSDIQNVAFGINVVTEVA